MLNRRDAMMRLGQFGLGALTLPGMLALEQQARGATVPPYIKTPGKAKSCILIFLWGGPPQQDMWDLKPDAPEGIRGHFKPIDTVVPGIQICDQMPLTAKHTDKLAIIRSMTHPSTIHEASCYHMLTGRENPTLVMPRNARSRKDFPNPGAIASYFSPAGIMPNNVTLPRPIGHDGVTYAGTYAGFLGPKHDPLETKAAGEVNDPAMHSLTLPQEIEMTRLLARQGLLSTIEAQDKQFDQQAKTMGLDAFREQAFRMLSSSKAKDAFRLELESDKVRDRYGRNEYGESFLLARRLVESGVRLVTVIWVYIAKDGNVLNVWDNHGGTGSLGSITGYQMLKENYCLPPLDMAHSALLEDLKQRGMLDETLVVTMGEFGRTSKINATVGRDHWGPCQSVTLAGGGIRGGQIYGASDAHAAYPKSNPVSPEDFLATIYYGMGISPESEITDQIGRPYRLSEGTPLTSLFG